MIYELRVYRCMPGRKGEVLARFRDHVMKFFTKHGIHVVGFWDTVVGDQDELLYIARYASFEDRERRWAAFQADPDWRQIRDKTHEHGWLVQHVRTALLSATDFSPSV